MCKLLFLAAVTPQGWIAIAVTIGILVFVIFAYALAKRYVKVGPNDVLIIYGRRRRMRMPDGSYETVGYRIAKGGGRFVWPIIEQYRVLSLEIITLDVKTPEVYTIQGVPIVVDGVAQIKVKGDDISIQTAAEQFLSKGKHEVMEIALQTVEGHLRAILGTMTVEEVYKNRDAFAQRVQEVAAGDMANMGLTIISFTIRDIRDSQGYLDALGKPRIAQVKRDAVIGQAEADRDATIKSAEANRDGQTAKFGADTKIAEADRDYEMKVAEYQASINLKKADADIAYDLQKFKRLQEVKKEEVQVEVVDRTERVRVQEAEALRKEKELTATIKKPAEAERYRVQTLAEAEKFKLETEAGGRAGATRATGFAGADVTAREGQAEADAAKAKGLAAADVIKAQGLAEAEAMRKKAESWGYYNEAAITQMFIDALPKLAAAIAEPLSRTEKIVIISTGGDSAGASKLTQDITKIIAQLPPVVESLTGVKMEEMIERIPGLGGQKAGKKTREVKAEVVEDEDKP
jgi:flotillin